jgi:hypothetical protein
MTHHITPSHAPPFGSLTWEYIPKQYGAQSFARFALALGFPGLILIFLRMSLISIVFLAPACIFIGLAFRMKKHRILFYESGMEDIRAGKIRSSSYDHLTIWQYIQTNDIRGLSEAYLRSYIIKFPDNSTLRTFDPEVGKQLQHCITQSQTNQVISDYKRGENIDFGPIRLNRQGITSSLDTWGKMISSLSSSGIFFYPTSSTCSKSPNCKVIPWSDVDQINLISGTLYVMQSNGQNLSIKASDIPNIFVLINLLQHLEY